MRPAIVLAAERERHLRRAAPGGTAPRPRARVVPARRMGPAETDVVPGRSGLLAADAEMRRWAGGPAAPGAVGRAHAGVFRRAPAPPTARRIRGSAPRTARSRSAPTPNAAGAEAGCDALAPGTDGRANPASP